MDHKSEISNLKSQGPSDDGPWYREMTRYHWWVLGVAALGWLFDCMDQRLFLMARQPAMRELLGPSVTPGEVTYMSGIATMIFMFGWATGGLVFGLLGDRIGRAKTMLLTILVYSLFTGLSAFSRGIYDFMFYRFLTGMGVGGEFAAGVTLVAEVMPARARVQALGLLQALSAVGNIIGSLLSWLIQPLSTTWLGGTYSGWRLLFLVGVLPALLVLLVLRKLKEPETWTAAKKSALEDVDKQLGAMGDLFENPTYRRNMLVGVTLALAGVVGLWGVGFWTPELNRAIVAEAHFREIEATRGAPLTDDEKKEMRQNDKQLKNRQERVAGIGFALQDVGAFFGILAFTAFTARVGRRLAFAVGFVSAFVASILVFGWMDREWQVFLVLPLLGFCNLSIFGGYAIYFTELFPTRLRATGTGFCYNVARYLAAMGPLTLGQLSLWFASRGNDSLDALRYAALSVASIYLLGLVALLFAPETKDKPLPE